MSACDTCGGGRPVYPGRRVPGGWRLINLQELMTAPAIGIYACPPCVATVPRLATAAERMAH